MEPRPHPCALSQTAKKKKSDIEKDYISGKIYRVQEDFLERFCNREKYEVSGLNPEEDIIEHIADVDAQWTKYVKIGDKYYWQMNMDFPPVMFHQDRLLPSDSVNRLDLIYWNLKDPLRGQAWKEKMEQA